MELASMLPGFRFLFSAIILSMSVLIFGLGAAALLRSAHEEFANLPSRRATPEPMFARLSDDPPPTLALLRVDPVAEQLAVPAPALDIPANQASDANTAEPEKLAAVTPAEPTPIETAKAEEPAKEAGMETAAAPAAEVPMATEVQIAAVAVPEPDTAAQTATPPQPAEDIPSFEPSIATTLIATLGGPAVQIEKKASIKEAKPDHSAARKKAAERIRERRRMAAIRRARLAREATLTLQQQQPNPFAFPLTPATTR
jgi:hypothetical protein